jgi:hypothetical protein
VVWQNQPTDSTLNNNKISEGKNEEGNETHTPNGMAAAPWQRLPYTVMLLL